MKSYDKELLAAWLKNEENVISQLQATYKQALKDIESKLKELLAREAEGGANLQSVIYQRQYQQALKKQVSAILDALQAEEFQTIADYLVKVYEDGFAGAIYSIQKQGIPLCFPLDQSQVVQAVQLDSKISTSLYTRCGENVAALKKAIAAEISRGISTNATYAQIARHLRNHMVGTYGTGTGGAVYRSMLIARTEGTRIVNHAALDACYKAREKGCKVVKEWCAALDARTRDSHARLDGERRELDEKFSNGLMRPGDPNGKAAEVCNCRCKLLERAKWALSADETQYLGDVSKMTAKQRETISKKLNIPDNELENYSKQIVPIKAKDYADFKRQYAKIWNYDNGRK